MLSQSFFTIGPLIFALLGLLVMVDAKRFSRHIKAAKDMIENGVPEAEAMHKSGCNHWDKAFWVRIWAKYPQLPKTNNEQN